MRIPVQLCTVADNELALTEYAVLCNDGSIWKCTESVNGFTNWRRLQDIPQGDVEEETHEEDT